MSCNFMSIIFTSVIFSAPTARCNQLLVTVHTSRRESYCLSLPSVYHSPSVIGVMLLCSATDHLLQPLPQSPLKQFVISSQSGVACSEASLNFMRPHQAICLIVRQEQWMYNASYDHRTIRLS